MQTTQSLPSYTELTNALQKTQALTEAAETHGLLCGIICATQGELPYDWEKQVIGPKPNPETSQLLQQAFDSSYQQISEFSLEFQLLLPSERTSLTNRTECLGLWCQGFLIGLNQREGLRELPFSTDAAEALEDITEIAQINSEETFDNNDNEANETAYIELVEYIRLAILMLYYEMAPATAHEDPSRNKT